MYKIKQLIIIGGLSCAGKSFLIKKIRQGDYPRLCEQLGIATPSSWHYAKDSYLAHIHLPIERLVVPYDITHRYSQKNGFENLYELISNSDSITIITLCASPKLLFQRVTLRIIKNIVRFLCDYKAYKHIRHEFRKLWMLWKTRNTYKNDFSVFAIYEKWFNFFNEYSATSHWLLDSNKLNITVAHPYETDKVLIFTGVKEVMDSYQGSPTDAIPLSSITASKHSR